MTDISQQLGTDQEPYDNQENNDQRVLNSRNQMKIRETIAVSISPRLIRIRETKAVSIPTELIRIRETKAVSIPTELIRIRELKTTTVSIWLSVSGKRK